VANEIEIRVTGKNASQPAIQGATKDTKGLADEVKKTGVEIDKTDAKAKHFGETARTTAAVAGGILAADALKEGARVAVESIKTTISAASNLNESLNAVQKIFHQNSQAVLDWGKNNANNFGLSQRAFNEFATPLGAALKNAGLSMDDVSDNTIKLTKRAADMASVFNTSVADALTAIQAGLRGEADPLERYGVGLSMARVQAQALADTHKTSTSQLTTQELTLARLKILYDQTSDSEGDFASTANGLANASRKSTAEIEDAKAKIGGSFLPVVSAATQATGKLAETIAAIPTPVLVTGAAIVGLGAAFVVLAPKLKAAKDLTDQLSNSNSVFVRGAGRVVTAVGKITGGLAAASIAGSILSDMFGNDLNPQIDAARVGLTEYAKGAAIAGEAQRLFGDNADQLNDDLVALGEGGFYKAINKADQWSAHLLGTTNMLDDAKDRVGAFDSALAQMVQNGQGDLALSLVEQAAKRANLSLDNVKSLLPQFTGAMEVAGQATKATGDAAAGAAVDLDDLEKAFRGTIEAAFGLDSAQDKLANDIARLVDQLKAQKDAHDKGAGSLDRNTQAGRDNAEMLRNLIEDTADLAVENQKAGKPIDDLKTNLKNQLIQMGLNAQQIQPYLDKLDELISTLNAIPKNVTTNVTVIHDAPGQSRNAHRTGGIQGASTGGVRGGLTTINEDGFEQVELPYGSMVRSHPDTQMDMMRQLGAGGGWGGAPRLEIGSDGSRIGDLLIEVLRVALAAKGGDPRLLGIVINR
jgi:hypothetical protein